jgi:hypothetical protein
VTYLLSSAELAAAAARRGASCPAACARRHFVALSEDRGVREHMHPVGGGARTHAAVIRRYQFPAARRHDELGGQHA